VIGLAGLTDAEQENVRRALRFLRVRAGGWNTLADALGFKRKTIKNVREGHNRVSPNLAFRVARMAGVPVDDLLAGKVAPAGMCIHCGGMTNG
jgi:DNA-binding XRE family transcriptional regulator